MEITVKVEKKPELILDICPHNRCKTEKLNMTEPEYLFIQKAMHDFRKAQILMMDSMTRKVSIKKSVVELLPGMDTQVKLK